MKYVAGAPVAIESSGSRVAVWVYNSAEPSDACIYELNCKSEEAAQSLVESWRAAFSLRPPEQSFTAGLLSRDIELLAEWV